MASAGKIVWGPNSRFTYNGTDLSDHVASLNGSDEADQVEVTGLGESYREYIRGLKTATISATLFQDYASNSVDALIGAAYYNDTAGTVKVTPDTNGTVVYTMVAKTYSYSPFNGSPGDANQFDVEFANFGTAGVTRGTA